MKSKRSQSMDASGIRKVFELANTLKNPISLSIGQPDFPIPDNIKEAACRAINEDKNNYSVTQGVDELLDLVVAKLAKKNNIKVTKENVMITSAVSGGLGVALPAVIDAGDEVIYFEPSFPGYKQAILLASGVPVAVRKNDDFSIKFDALKNAITNKTKAIIFNTPENPTGHVSDMSEIDQLIEIARKHDLIIISDEIYEDFIYDVPHISIGAAYDKTISLFGFSKSHAMTGWRVGYLSAPAELITEMIKIQQFAFVCAPTPLQHAACEAIRTDMSEYIRAYQKKRDLIYEGLKDHYEIIKPQGAFYFFIKYPCAPDKFMAQCLERNLLLVSGDVFGSQNTHFRLSFATSDENLKKAIEILREIAAVYC